MSTRSRRANAGNRLSMLLAEQTPLNDEDAEIFAERDDDEDFDLEAEEKRLRMASAASSDHARGSEGEDDDSNNEDDDEDDESGSEHDDENFSDTTDDSELENDAEPADAGEKELAKEQRAHAREQRIAERNKMFVIKRRAPKPEGASAEQRKKRVFTSADLLLKGRHSSRKSALRNKQHLIEQMREVEERRARYVPPKRTKQPKLTQAQRLEEAIKTEARNLASLNKFVELEEERKLQQRLAMISRRPKLTQFVRFHSSRYLEEPKLIEVVPEKDEDEQPKLEPVAANNADGMGQDDPPKPARKEEAPPSDLNSNAPGSREAPESAPGHDLVREAPTKTAEDSAALTVETSGDAIPESTKNDDFVNPESIDSENIESTHSTEPHSTESHSTETPSTEPHSTEPHGTEPRSTIPGTEVHDTKSASPNEHIALEEKPGSRGERSAAIEQPASADSDAHAPAVKVEAGSSADPEGEGFADVKAKTELVTEPNPVQGPAQLKTYDFLTLHEFADVAINKYAARNIILGRIASRPAHMPLKRMCPFSGLPAKYLDPSTGVAYYGLETNKLLKRAADNKLDWNKELGGVFLGTGSPQRHAKGVPEGFA